ncbi:MAG TPA: tRNA pseudouridine synthase A, partial [Rubricoccaceae bacterium]
MPTIRLLVEYDGTDFRGWQRQANGPSVQEALEDALATILRGPIGIVGAGRTDTGVHARGQVAQFETETDLDVHRLLASLAGLLPSGIAVRCAETAPPGFHARFDAVSRTYHYHVATGARALDRRTRVVLRGATPFGADAFEAMNRAAEAILGRHEFSSFCRTASETINRTCAVEVARWRPETRPGDWRFEITADRFV